MMNARQTNQTGSVAAFIVVGVVLAALIAGGMYALKQRSVAVGATGTQTPVAVNNQPAASRGASAPSSSAVSSQSPVASSKPTATTSATASASARPTTPTPTPTPTPTASATASPQVATTPNTANALQAGGAASQLPKTGPSDSMIQVIASAVLLGGVIAYFQSYRHRFGSLFR